MELYFLILLWPKSFFIVSANILPTKKKNYWKSQESIILFDKSNKTKLWKVRKVYGLKLHKEKRGGRKGVLRKTNTNLI